MGLTTVPVGEPVPKRTLRGTLVGAEGLTFSSTPFAVPFKLAFDAALAASRFAHIKCKSIIFKQDRKNQDRRLYLTLYGLEGSL